MSITGANNCFIGKKNFLINCDLGIKVEKFCNMHRINLLHLYTSMWVYCKSLESGNNNETIGIMNRRKMVEAKSFEIKTEQNGISFINTVNEELCSSTDNLENVEEIPTASFDVVLYEYNEGEEYNFDWSKYELTVGFESKENSINIIYNYLTDKISDEMLLIYHNRIQRVCEQIIINEQINLKDISLLDEYEKNKVLFEFNCTDAKYPENKTIIELFEEQVEKTPDNIALEFDRSLLTYREMNGRINYIGELLRNHGIKPDNIVAIISDKSIEMLLAIYGILKAGGAYLPIGPDLPINRIKYMIEDSGAKVVLAGPGSEDVIKELKDVVVINLLSCDEKVTHNLEHVSKPNNLAYVIYTSGTTGNPKGVMVENGNLINLIVWMLKDGYDENDVIITKTTYTFDLSVWELFIWFFAGARLALISKNDEKDPKKIAEKIKEYKATRISFVPSVLETFLPFVNSDEVKTLRKIQLSGEALPLELAIKYNKLSKGRSSLINSYGPTETTVFATSLSVPADTNIGIMHIGKPIANTQIYILNNGNLCGIGMIGEVYIGGAGVSRGYLNRPELNAEKFLENPYRPAERMYRTGDLARWMENGNIEYLGRIDEQVKIRGFRIELGEIKSRIREIEGVQSAAVIVREENNDKYLCAYVVSDSVIDAAFIKERLSKSLSDYMIPAHIIQIESIPVTKNGKLDKKALPKPQIVSTHEYIAPRDRIETCIAKAFEEILNLNKIGIDDNFFELGGHSLRATNLVNMLEKELNVRIPLREVLKGKTVRKLAEIVKVSEDIYKYIPINIQPKKNAYEMSSVQKRLFLIEQTQESSTAYNIPIMLKMVGKINLERLQNAINQLCERHELLRTHFDNEKGRFLQIIDNSVELKLEYEEIDKGDLQKIIDKFIRPFDLSKAPLMRSKVIYTNDHETILLIDIHHIIYDEGSANVLFGDLSNLYNGINLPDSCPQYKDYCAWLESRDLSKQEQFWLEEFSNEVPILDLKTDYPRPLQQSHKGSRITTTLSNELKDAVKLLSVETSSTDYMVLLSIFMILLSKYSRQKEIIVGSPIAGRVHPDTQNMIGMFVNTLAIKGHLDKKKKYIDFLECIKEKCFKVYENQEFPFEDLVEIAKIERDPSRNPLFNIMFVLQNNEKVELLLEDNKLEPVELQSNGAVFDLTVSMKETSNGYELCWEYCTDLFKQETIERMSVHFRELLIDSLNNPQKELGELSMLSENEQEKVLNEFNATDVEYPLDKTIIELFEEQVERTPDKIAVKFADQTLTYRQLNSRANYLGQLLRNAGVKAESIVAISTERSLEMIIGIYSILKAGGAYLPIAPDYPADRINYILEDSETKIILIGPGSQIISDKLKNISTVYLKDCTMEIHENLEHISGPNNLAYTIYTSGTTGNPKGVMIENRNVVNLAKWQIENGEYNYESTIIQKTTYVFDGSVWEIFPIGLAGCQLELISEEQNNDMEKLIELLPGKQIALIPSMLRILLDYAKINNKAHLLKLDKLYLAAELLTADLVENYKTTAENRLDTLYNLYGPTEATVTATYYRFSDEINVDIIPIGKPISNTQIYIINDNNLCGIGVPGELCIGGTGVGRGYLNRPELTTEKFIANPYRPGERIYRTGDLARWMENGNIEYLGRIDEQVKIRGFRIEIGEIESRLREIPEIQDAVVIVREKNGDKHLCGYIVSNRDFDINEIKNELNKNLPEYMIPAYLMQINTLPLTKNGKIDKKALPEPQSTSSNEFVAPRDELETCIAKAYQDVLGIEQVGIDDSFFEIGGHSLRASKLVNLVEENLGIRIPLRDVLTEKTVRKLAIKVRENTYNKKYERLKIQPQKSSYSMSSAQKRLYIIDQMQGENIIYNTPIRLKVCGKFDFVLFQQALNKLCQHEEMLRTHFVQEKDKFLQIIDDKVDLELEFEEASASDIEAISERFVRPFNLGKAPLMRAKAIKVQDNQTILLLDIHHIICDGGSTGVILNNLTKFYNQEKVEDHRVQYKDYSAWQNSRDMSEHEKYWLEEFSEEIPLLDIQTDFPRPQYQSFKGERITTSLSKEHNNAIKNLCRITGATDYMILLSALMLLLNRYSRQEEIIVGSPIAGRNHPDTQNMLGMFVNTLAIKGKVSPNINFIELVNSIKEKCLKVYDYQDYPFEKLVEKIEIERDPSRNPLFDVMFALENNEPVVLTLGDSKLTPVNFEADITKFDLTITAQDTAEGYILSWEYCSDLFKKETIEKMGEHLYELITDALNNPDKCIADIQLISDKEKDKLTEEFNVTAAEYPDDKTVIELFEEQVKRVADNIAVEFGEETLTYRKLNERANYVGERIRKMGVKPDNIVGLISERSIEMIVGIYGILKAGGAYVPIDPEHPIDRIKYMLQDCEAKVLLMGPGSENIVSELQDYNIIDLTECKGETTDNLPVIAEPNNLAYVIFTSGTTGKPKGVMVENRNLLNLTTWQIANGNINENSVMLQKSTYVFDASVWEIFSAGLAGCKLELLPESKHNDPEELFEVFTKKQITHALIVPSMFRMLLEYAENNNKADGFKSFRKIFLGAEAVTHDLIEKYLKITGNKKDTLVNLYGPTEGTVCVTSYDFAQYADAYTVPIGKPISNTRIYILNGNSLCGVGMPGELCFSGDSVSRGYLNRPSLTSEKFVENPYKKDEIIYRTGDLARWAEDGNIEYLGRIDEQVKLRGFRIELGEIENKLRDIYGIQDAVVLIKEENGDKYLCGYVVSDKDINANEVKNQLGKSLPKYMVPSYIMQLDKLPMTRSGKVDKKALPKPEITSTKEYVAPRDELEVCIVEAFKVILGAEQIGIDDDFFELGGDSIKAIRIVSKIRDYGYQISVRDIIEGRSIRIIRTGIRKIETNTAKNSEVTGEVGLTPIQKDFFSAQLLEPNHFNQAFIFEYKGTVNLECLEKALTALTLHHDMLRAVYKDGNQFVKPIDNNKFYDLSFYDFSNIKDYEELSIMIDEKANTIQSSIDISSGPLLKVGLFRTDEKDYLMLCIHHLVVDGVSWRIIIEDLNTSYTSAIENKSISLPAKTTSFQFWSEKVREYRDSHTQKGEISYWLDIEKKVKKSRLQAASVNRNNKIENIEIDFSKNLTSRLLYNANKTFSTEINDLLLTALFRAIKDTTNMETVSVNLEGHGREYIGDKIIIDRTVGWFTSVYPVAVSQIGKSISEDIRNTKETLRRIPNRGMGYGVLKTLGDEVVEGIEADITFNYLGEFGQENYTQGFMMSNMPRGLDVSKRNMLGPAISINGAITDKKLSMTLSYDKSVYDMKFIEALKGNFVDQLTKVIEYCDQTKEKEYTASDFGELIWTDEEFSKIVKRFNKDGFKIERIYPMTAMQEGMLYHKIENEDSTSYIVQSLYKVKKSINKNYFTESLELLAAKHGILRTSMVYRNVSEPRQVLLNNRAIELNYYDLSEEISPLDRYEEIRKEDINRGFDLEKDSLLRIALIKLNEDVTYMMMSFHHIIIDGWCISIILNDMTRFYGELCSGKSKNQLKQDIPHSGGYEAYSRMMQNKDKDAVLKYWEELLEGYDEYSGINPETKEKEDLDQGHRIEISLTSEDTNRLEEIGSKYGVTINTIVEAAWGILLQRYNNTKDVVFGKVVSGRNLDLEGIEEIVGIFINTIPVRVENDEEETFGELLVKLQKQALTSQEYNYCPLADVQNQSRLGSGLIQTILAFENYYDHEDKEEDSLGLEMIEAREQTNYPLTLCAYKSDKLFLGLMYDANKYGSHEVEKILKRLQSILNRVAENPELEISCIEVVESKEKDIVLNKFNDTTTECPVSKTIIELFEEQVKKTPEKIAVVSNNKDITYTQLNNRANQLARKLKKLGVIADEFVGIMAERRLEVVIGILGILKAGGAYLPIDPKYPSSRMQYIFKDSNCKIVLTGSTDLSGISDLSVEKINLLTDDVTEESDENLDIINSSRDLAYLIYTSGTTGDPKGVMIEHRSVIRLVKNTNYIDFNDAVILQTGSLTFDASTFEIWGALLNGGSLYLVDNDILTNCKLLKRAISDYKINTLWLTVSLYNQMISEDKETFDELTYLLIGGEKLSELHVKLLRDRNKNIRLINGYGPTESTTFAVTYAFEDEVRSPIPIGKPISNTQVYILNKNTLCGVGMPGELCIGGPGLARGYLNSPELTSLKFVENPYKPGEILYRTGDLARWTNDGNIEYIGRIDEQVKLRGFRIELGEIENKLKEMPDIQDAVVIAREDKNDKYLCAYIVTENNIDINISKIKNRLELILPEYMIPAYMMRLDRIPVTRNGKLDKRALPNPEVTSTKEYAAPRNEVEICIADAFQEILKLERVGIDDSFFELGGHSLKATRLINIIEEKINVRISLRDILAERTVRKLAEIVKNISESNEYTAIEPHPKKDSYPMSSAQKRIYIINQMQGENITYNIPDLLKIQGIVDPERLQSSLDRLIEQHEVLRTSFVMEEGKLVQKISDSVKLKLEYSKGSAEDINSIFKEFVRPFDLSKAPLMRAKVVNIGDETILMFDMHHIIYDGGSVSPFFNDLSKLYKGENLPKNRVHYKDYSVWQSKKDISKQEEYWLNEFSGEISVLDLHTDFPRPQKQSQKGNCISTLLSKEEKDRVKAIGLQTGATEYMILLSALMMLLSRYSRKEEIVVGTPVSGRIHPDTHNMIGMFVNTLAIKGVYSAKMKFTEAVEHIKEKCLKAFENQEYPFEELVEKIGIERDLSRNPLFDVAFVLQNSENADLDFDGMNAVPINFDNTVAKFDLTISMREMDEGYEVVWEFCTDLFRKETIERMAEHFKEILTDALSNPQKELWEIQMLSSHEQERILKEFNMTTEDYPQDKTIVELFEEQVKKSPQNIAIVLNNQSITYAQLNEKSNQLARKLRGMGVKANSFVGIMAERRIEIIIGILSILKAGGAYLPIDPKYPMEQIKYILKDSQCKVLITGDTDLSEMEDNFVEVINLSNSDISTWPIENPRIINKSEDLAYCIYTSGTTGEPKGVMIEQRSVIRLVKNTNYVDFNDVRILQTGSLTFDASTFEIWGALLNGGRLYLINQNDLLNAESLKQVLVNCKINTMFITTALFNQLISIDNTFFDSLSQLLFGGEATSEEHVRKLVERNIDLKLSNVYGPTETTTFATFFPIHAGKLRIKTPIGKPISNTTAYVLNGTSLCGIGIPGELCIGGPGVSRGYLNRLELTAEKFIENPLCKDEIIYRTGDLVRWLEDGNIEYLGRIDEQVKIRGFRIELGGIESKIREISNVKDTAVIVREENGDKYICAYVVGKENIKGSEVKAYLSKSLPEYMIPKYIMIIDSLPMNKNGKLHKKALPNPETKELKNYVAPRDEEEACIVSVFENLLGVKNVGIDDSFFELGGDSIKAIRVISKLREYGYEISIRNIMKDKTPRAIRQGIGKVEISSEDQTEITGNVGLTPIQLDFFMNNLEEENHFNQSFLFECKERIDQSCLEKAIIAVVEHHDMLRSKYSNHIQTIRKISEGNLYELKYYNLKDIKDEELLYSKIYETTYAIQTSINLSEGPLFKSGVLCTENKDYLFITIHHLVVDGVSWRILMEDLTNGYMAAKNRKELILPSKTVSYKKWSETLRRYRDIGDLKEEIPYWRQIEEKLVESRLSSKIDGVQYGIEDVNVDLTCEQTRDLLYKAGRAYNTEINDLLLTSLFRAVNKVTGLKHVSVSMEGHGREPIGTSMKIDRTVGWFTSIYPVAISGIGETIREDIYRTKEVLRQIPNNGIGYGILKSLGEKVLVGIAPDITFNYLGELGQENDMGHFILSDIARGEDISERNRFGTPISINGAVTNKELHIIINYDKSRFDKHFMDCLSKEYKQQLIDVILHCVEEREKQGKETVDCGSANELNLSQFIWTRFSLDNILKSIKLKEQVHSVLFVESMDQKLRKEIINAIAAEPQLLKLMPQYIIHMDKYQLSESVMDEKAFREMCCDDTLNSNEAPTQIEVERFTNNLKSKVMDQYKASIIQKSFIEIPGTTLVEEVEINGFYPKDKIVEAVKIVAEEQSVFRSSFIKHDSDYIINTHQYDSSWYVPYIDLRYVSSNYITSVFECIRDMRNELVKDDSLNNMMRLVIIRYSETCHKIYAIVHHCGWDKASTQIFKDRITDIVKLNFTKLLNETTYKHYIEENRACIKNINIADCALDTRINAFIKSVNEYLKYNNDNTLEKVKLATFKVGTNLLKILKEKPWSLLMQILGIIARENNLIPKDGTNLPVIILKEDRRDKKKDYSNLMGVFLDELPILVNCTNGVVKSDFQGEIEKVLSIKREKAINFMELLCKEQQDIQLLVTSILSINYQGIFELTYDLVQKMFSIDNLKLTPEIFVNCYSNYLVMSLPIYKRCSDNLEEVLQNEFELLEKELVSETIF